MNADRIDHEWLVARFTARFEIPQNGSGYAYETGRIDEFCTQNAITTEERVAAAGEAARLFVEAGGVL